MNDWQAALKKALKELEVKQAQAIEISDETSEQPIHRKKHRGRGALPLLRNQSRKHRRNLEEDDGPPIHNWRKSPMER